MVLVLHLLGVIFWFAGLLVLTRFLKCCSEEISGSEKLLGFMVGTWRGFVLGGLGLTLVAGVVLFGQGGVSFYMKQGWMHAKLTLALLAFVLTAFVGNSVVASAKGSPVARKTAVALHAGAATLLLGILILVKLKPF